MANLGKIIRDLDFQGWILVICGISAMALSIVGFFGLWTISSGNINSVILGGFGVIMTSLVITQYTTKAILKKIGSGVEQDFSVHFPDGKLQEDISRAETFDMYGIEMGKSISALRENLEKRVKKEVTIRFLIADPNGGTVKMVTNKYSPPLTKTKGNIEQTIDIMRSIRGKAIDPKKVMIKKLDFLFPRKAIFVDAEKSHGVVYITNYTFGIPGKKGKFIHKKGESNYFDFYYSEFEKMWKCGKEIP